MARIEKKIWPQYFELVSSGKKKFELRVADFEVDEGVTLVLQEWNPDTEEYTGRAIEKKVDLVFRFHSGDFGQKEKVEKKGLYVIQLK